MICQRKQLLRRLRLLLPELTPGSRQQRPGTQAREGRNPRSPVQTMGVRVGGCRLRKKRGSCTTELSLMSRGSKGLVPHLLLPLPRCVLTLSHVMDFTESDASGFFCRLSHLFPSRRHPRGPMDLLYSLVPLPPPPALPRRLHGPPQRRRSFVSTIKHKMLLKGFMVSMKQAVQG